MSAPVNAVFLGYASEDAVAAERVATALRQAGAEVWFDQRELRGGEVWDAAIRSQIRSCALFVPIISASAHARVEGYFRLEWKLAIDRSHLIAPDQPFLLPVVIDETARADGRLPERFRDVQWTYAPRGDSPPAFMERVVQLLRLRPPDAERQPPPVHATPAPVPAPAPARRLGNRVWAPAFAMLAAIAIGTSWIFARVTATHAVPTAPSVTAAATPQASVAVMPFANLTGDAGKDYFSDGMAEELIDSLSQVPNLKVPARTSSFAYKGRNTDIRTIAHDLGVRTILEGSVRSAAGRIRVTAELIDAVTGYHLWSQSYDRDFADIFKVQDDLAAAIVQALQMKMGLTGSMVAHAAPTQDVEAYRYYLQGRAYDDATNTKGAIALYDQALARDPKFAAALAFRSAAEASLGEMKAAQRDAQLALQLDPKLPYAHGALAILSDVRGDWVTAEQHWRAALAAAPGDSTILLTHAGVVAATGQLHEAWIETRKAREVAPASMNVAATFAFLSSIQELDDDALRYADEAIHLGMPAFPLMAILKSNTAMRRGNAAQAAQELGQTFTPKVLAAGGIEMSRLVFAARGHPEKFRSALDAIDKLLAQVPADGSDPAFERQLILDFVMVGAVDRAFALAERYVDRAVRADRHGVEEWTYLWIPDMRSFRVDPRFSPLLKRLNLIAYWQRFGPPDSCRLQGDTVACQ